MKILFVCSGGGHYKELMEIKKLIPSEYNIKIATMKGKDTNEKNYELIGVNRNFINFLINLKQAFNILNEYNPDLIISNGAGTAFNMCLLGKILSKKILFIDCLTRIDDLSTCGKLIYYLNLFDIFLVHWKELSKKYKKVSYWGNIL